MTIQVTYYRRDEDPGVDSGRIGRVNLRRVPRKGDVVCVDDFYYRVKRVVWENDGSVDILVKPAKPSDLF